MLTAYLSPFDEGTQVDWVNPISLTGADEDVRELISIKQRVDIALRAAEVVSYLLDRQKWLRRRTQRTTPGVSNSGERDLDRNGSRCLLLFLFVRDSAVEYGEDCSTFRQRDLRECKPVHRSSPFESEKFVSLVTLRLRTQKLGIRNHRVDLAPPEGLSKIHTHRTIGSTWAVASS